MGNLLKSYLLAHDGEISDQTIAYLANLQQVASVCPKTAQLIIDELEDQRSSLKLIASENYSSIPCQSAMANLLTDKYAEGYAHHRFYAGCGNVDELESLACERACQLFGGEGAATHSYVQPHSGADANLVAFWAILSKRVMDAQLDQLGKKNLHALTDDEWKELRGQLGNQRLLGMALDHGGHLTHGFRLNVSAKMFESHSYGVDPKTSEIDYDDLQQRAQQVRPLIFLAGYSAYPRKIDFRKMREIADSVGAVLMVDMAHFAGLVAGGVFTGDFNPIPFADVVTSTTHKTLRGPRGGLVLCTEEFAGHVDKGCPYVLGGPLPHVMAAKSVCFAEALDSDFQSYAASIVDNARSLAEGLIAGGIKVVTGGTDNHLVLVDVSELDTPGEYSLNGRQAESSLRECGITLNRNTIPKPGKMDHAWYPSGLRLGTPALTTLGMRRDEMLEIASIVSTVLKNTEPLDEKAKYSLDADVKSEALARVQKLLGAYPLYPELDSAVLRESLAPKLAAT